MKFPGAELFDLNNKLIKDNSNPNVWQIISAKLANII
jgi:hypothetical protein